MNRTMLAASVFALLSTPAVAQAQQSQAERPAATSGQAAQQGQEQIKVAAARRLVGDMVQDTSGKDLGTVEYLLIGIDDARVRYAVVAPEEGDGLVPVPWTALNTSRYGDDVLTTDRATFGKQKRFKQEQIAELTQPMVITQTYEVWAPVSAPASQGSASKPSGKEPQKQGAQQGKQAEGAGDPHILVGQDVVTTILPPVFRASDALRGSEVYTADNKEYGEVDDLMIDLAHGRVAYVQVGHGGFLGLGEEITPVPFEALSYDRERDAYRVAKSENELEEVRSFARGETPHSVRSSDLGKLFSEFSAQPYWQERS